MWARIPLSSKIVVKDFDLFNQRSSNVLPNVPTFRLLWNFPNSIQVKIWLVENLSREIQAILYINSNKWQANQSPFFLVNNTKDECARFRN